MTESRMVDESVVVEATVNFPDLPRIGDPVYLDSQHCYNSDVTAVEWVLSEKKKNVFEPVIFLKHFTWEPDKEDRERASVHEEVARLKRELKDPKIFAVEFHDNKHIVVE